MREFADVGELCRAQGEELGFSDWLPIVQAQVDAFAEATLDDQWIHTDPERAADGPFGATIAHGYLILALLPHFTTQIVRVRERSMGVNYGLGRVRFPSPVRVGSRIRGSMVLAEAQEHPEWAQVVYRTTVEIEGQDKPACVAETLARIYR